MPAPSPLAIATSSLNRLVKEEGSYNKESIEQQASIAKLERNLEEGGSDVDENAEFMLKQQKKALEETKAIFPQLKSKIMEAKSKLDSLLAQSSNGGDQSNPEEITKAKEASEAALHILRTIA